TGASLPHKVIVFCGVRFMAETAAILSPDKVVVLPDEDAGCPMVDMVKPEDVRKEKEKHPGVPVVSYVNTSAEVKAETDYCCTSANAVKVVHEIPGREVLFFPDQHLGSYVQEKLPEKKLHLWPGYCIVHVRILPEDIQKARKQYPGAVVMVHPECRKEVRDLADEVLSTGGMVKYARENKAKEFIVGTEVGIIHRLKKENPGKEFYPASKLAVCANMKKITIDKVLSSLETLTPRISLPAGIIQKARQAIERMVKIG
ncbi:MAG: quinolinate synthase NadA, partial [Caldiserica bacterium]|nr:quinolinate synthase NadA [Caldisericota bacterium]